MIKQTQDVDEWLLSGLSESNENTMAEDAIIMKKIEENQMKQASSQVEKTYIIDEFTDDFMDDEYNYNEEEEASQ